MYKRALFMSLLLAVIYFSSNFFNNFSFDTRTMSIGNSYSLLPIHLYIPCDAVRLKTFISFRTLLNYNKSTNILILLSIISYINFVTDYTSLHGQKSIPVDNRMPNSHYSQYIILHTTTKKSKWMMF